MRHCLRDPTFNTIPDCDRHTHTFNSSNCDDLGCMSRSFIDCNLFFYTDKRVVRSSAIAELLHELNLDLGVDLTRMRDVINGRRR